MNVWEADYDRHQRSSDLAHNLLRLQRELIRLHLKLRSAEDAYFHKAFPGPRSILYRVTSRPPSANSRALCLRQQQ